MVEDGNLTQEDFSWALQAWRSVGSGEQESDGERGADTTAEPRFQGGRSGLEETRGTSSLDVKMMPCLSLLESSSSTGGERCE